MNNIEYYIRTTCRLNQREWDELEHKILAEDFWDELEHKLLQNYSEAHKVTEATQDTDTASLYPSRLLMNNLYGKIIQKPTKSQKHSD